MDLELLKTAASTCTNCELHEGRLNPVFAKGNPTSRIMICGMVPADEENKAGLPFVGRAGQLLDNILADMGWTLDDVYITNLVKCYLAAGLPLKPSWVEACLPYLIAQIGFIKPRVIIALGKDASSTLLNTDSKVALGKIRKQRVYDYTPEIKVIPTYHPSYLLRGGGIKHKSYSAVLADFHLAAEIALDK
jgi:uracil-DNA glycosylase family 4